MEQTMHLFCYTDDLELLRVELPVEEIAEDRIDPWRIDLCDPNPLKKNIDGRVLNFRRLKDITCVYRTKTGEAVVCHHDGEMESCVHGTFVHSDKMGLMVCDLQPSELLYVEHLTEYLRLL